MVATTLATCAVFVPIAFMSGVVGRFFREFGLVATCAVLVSMLVSLTLTPMLCARYLRAQTPSRARLWARSSAATARSRRHYRRALAWGLRAPPAVVGARARGGGRRRLAGARACRSTS